MKNWLHESSANTSRLWAVSSRLTCLLVSTWSKIWLKHLNKPRVHNLDLFFKLLDNRDLSRGLITVSNHYCCADDPLLWGIMKWRQVLSSNFRWIPSAYEICFSNVVHATFFSLGRCVPVVRGDGVYQKGMDLCLEKLNEGQWVHIFPEGKVNETKEAIRFKWGVGRLIMDSKLPPVVLPVFHIGMDNVLPNKMPYIPKVGKEVTIMFGEPLDYTELLDKLRKMNNSPMEIRKCITDNIQVEMLKLKVKAKGYHEQWMTTNNGS